MTDLREMCPLKQDCFHACPWIGTQEIERELRDGRKEKVNVAIMCGEWKKLKGMHCKSLIEDKIRNMLIRTDQTWGKIVKFDDYKWLQKEHFQEIRGIPWRSKEDFLFYIYSDFGTGKTTACVALVYECIQNGIIAWYTTAARMRKVYAMQNSFDSEISKTCSEEIQSMVRCELLIIDDFAYEGESEKGAFPKCLAPHLTSYGKKIILVSNNKFWDTDFLYADNEYIMDRLRAAVLIKWKDQSHRGKGGK